MGEYERAAFGRPLILFVLFLQGAQRVRFLSFRRGGPMWPPARMVPRIFVGADDPYPLCPFGASPPDRGSRPHRPAGTGSGPFWGCFACGRVTFCADRKSPKSRQRGEGVRIVPTPFVSLRSTFPPDRGNRPSPL